MPKKNTSGRLFAATLGARPEAITNALDALSTACTFQTAAIIHTYDQEPTIAKSLKLLRPVMKQDYPDLNIEWKQITTKQNTPLRDIATESDADAYYQGIVAILSEYKERGFTISLLVSGGRKAMSIYAAFAAVQVFTHKDSVWTILSTDILHDIEGQFHVSAEYQKKQRLVKLPVVYGRRTGAKNHVIIDTLETGLLNGAKLREEFIAKLTRSELTIIETLENDPYIPNTELAAKLIKSVSTIENQMRSIYTKVDLITQGRISTEHIASHNKRQLLLDILQRRKV